MIARSGVLKFETSKECQRAVAFAHTVEMGRKVAIISNTRSSDFHLYLTRGDISKEIRKGGGSSESHLS